MKFFRKKRNKLTATFLMLVLLAVALFPMFSSLKVVHAQHNDIPLEEIVDVDTTPETPDAPKVDKSFFSENIWKPLMSYVGTLLLVVSGFVLWLAGLLFNAAINFGVVEMKANLPSGAIGSAWATFRDIANIFFIFIILYIAIGTILRLDSVNTKKLLVHVIIIALLLNFSLFFTKIIIDASNILATFFVEAMQESVEAMQESAVSDSNLGVSSAFMKPLGLTSFMDAGGANALIKQADTWVNMLLIGFLGLILFLTVAFILFAAAILVLLRFLILIFIMILSPLAFMAMALPKDEYSKKWWDALFSQAIWLPVFFALLLVSVKVLREVADAYTSNAWTQLIADGASGQPEPGAIALLIDFIIIIGLAVLSLVSAKQIGAIGGSTMVRWGGGAARYVGGGLAAATARTAIRGGEGAGRAMGRFGGRIRQSNFAQQKGLAGATARFAGRGVEGLGAVARAFSLRNIYEKAARSRWIPKAPLEATAGALMRRKIGSKSVMEAHQESLDLTNYYKSRKARRKAEKEERRLEREGAPEEKKEEARKKREQVEEEEKRTKAKVEKNYYTPDMQRAEEEEKELATTMKNIEEAMQQYTQALENLKKQEESSDTKKSRPSSSEAKPTAENEGETEEKKEGEEGIRQIREQRRKEKREEDEEDK